MSDNRELLKALAQEARSFSSYEEETENIEKPKKEFEISLYEYPDLIVTRKTSRTTKHLIIMPSAGAVFIKTEENNKEAVSEPLNEKNYAAFTSGMEDIEMPEDFWGKCLSKGVAFGRRILEIFDDEILLEMIRKRAFPEKCDLLQVCGKYETRPEAEIKRAYHAYPQLFTEFIEKKKALSLLVNHIDFCSGIINMFGLQNARDFFRAYEESLVVIAEGRRGYYYRSVDYLTRQGNEIEEWEVLAEDHDPHKVYAKIPWCRLKYESFKDYVLYDSFRMGYGLNMTTFLSEWIDTLNMQWQVYGKIRNKYPTDLPILHNQLSYKVAMMKEKIDEKKFGKQVELAKKYEGNHMGYTFIAPKTKQDFLDEATMQCNCLAGYIEKFTEGNCLILFMRKKAAQEVSYITIELVNNSVVQAKLARNKAPSQYDIGVIEDWVEKCNKKMCG